MKKVLFISLFFFICLTVTTVNAWYPRAPEDQVLNDKGPAPIVGQNRYYQVADGETLVQLARAFGLSYTNLIAANPGIDPWLPPVGRRITLPYATILPEGIATGITINLAEYKLYHVVEHEGLRSVRIYPVGIGVEGWESPLGHFNILSKSIKPTWKVPSTIRAEDPSLPRFVKPGPDNPLGDYWMAFTSQRHGIHGTNEPYGVGRRVSHGCIRLYPEDIKDLFRRTRVGTPVNVIYEPLKLGIREGEVYIEAHPDYMNSQPTVTEFVARQCEKLGCGDLINSSQLNFVEKQRLGYPLSVTFSKENLAYREITR